MRKQGMHENIDQLPFAPIYFSFHIDAFRVFSMNNPIWRRTGEGAGCTRRA
ncbi:unnamed protein product [Ascophyllum nodosum]